MRGRKKKTHALRVPDLLFLLLLRCRNQKAVKFKACQSFEGKITIFNTAFSGVEHPLSWFLVCEKENLVYSNTGRNSFGKVSFQSSGCRGTIMKVQFTV